MNKSKANAPVDIVTIYNDTLRVKKGAAINIEFEIRLNNVTRDLFIDLFTKMLSENSKSAQLSTTINFVNASAKKDKKESIIRTIEYKGGVKMPEVNTRKTRLALPTVVKDQYIQYSLNVNQEEPTKSVPLDDSTLVRFKVRTSFNLGAWRADFTIVRNGKLGEIGPNLQDIKGKLFAPSLSASNMTSAIPENEISAYEIELEYLDNQKLSNDAINAAVQMLLEKMNPNIQGAILNKQELKYIALNTIPSVEMRASIREYTLKNVSNQVVTLVKDYYVRNLYPPRSFYLTDKADGQRMILTCHDGRVFMTTGKQTIMIEDSNIGIKSQVILDCELLDDKKILVFDCMMVDSKNIAGEPFATRVEQIARAISGLQIPEYTIIAKKFIKLSSDNLTDIEKFYKLKRDYEIDGLIFTEANNTYYNTKNYKWKPYEHMTIDFLAVKCPSSLLGTSPYLPARHEGQTLYILFVGISESMMNSLGLTKIKSYNEMIKDAPVEMGGANKYFPIQFSPSINPYAHIFYSDADCDNKIVELRMNNEGAWQLVKERTDREVKLGNYNDYRVAELNYCNYVDRFDIENLWAPGSTYFNDSNDDTKNDVSTYATSNRYRRTIINDIFARELKDAKYVIDLAAGRGADLARYANVGVKNALFVDIDKTAIVELIGRKFSALVHHGKHRAGSSAALNVFTLVADLKTPVNDLISKIAAFNITPGIVDSIICNFALHYMCDMMANLQNVLHLVSMMLKKNGTFIFVVMNGAAIFELLAPYKQGETYALEEGGATKYAIRKDYSDVSLKPVGQMISIKLPFSNELRQEPLANIEFIIKEAQKYGLEEQINMSFKNIAIDNSKLTDQDKQYNSLFSYVILKKVNEYTPSAPVKKGGKVTISRKKKA